MNADVECAETNPLLQPLLNTIETARGLQASNAALREALQVAVGLLAEQEHTLQRLRQHLVRGESGPDR